MNFKAKMEKIMVMDGAVERRRAADNLYASQVGPATQENTILWKIARDPYYPQTYLRYGNKAIVEAGFFDDLISCNKNSIPVADVARFLTPKTKVNIDATSRKNVIAILTGAFCPIHKGHVEILEVAKRELEERGYHVAGGFVCPDNQTYILRKYKKAPLSVTQRIALCEKMVKNSMWIDVSKVGMYGFPKDVNYTEIIYHMKQTFPECNIAYVYGSDNGGFSWLFEDDIIGVCVKRDGDGGKFENYREMFENIDSVIFSDIKREYSNLSSTKIRAKASKPVYLVRDDSSIVTSGFLQFSSPSKIKLANANMVNKILKIIRKRVFNVDVRSISVTEQTKLFNANFSPSYSVISLDMHFQGDYQLGVSRVFEGSGKQESPLAFMSRNMLSSVENEISTIPSGEYTLVDDDTASGDTLDYIIKELLDRGIIIKEIFLMNKAVGENFFDVVDMRDFIIGSMQSGLTISKSSGLFKAPYCFPYVNLSSRAKLNECMDASYEIWKANLEYYKSVAPGLTISELYPPFLALMIDAGFDAHDTVTWVCKWHMNLCKQTSK